MLGTRKNARVRKSRDARRGGTGTPREARARTCCARRLGRSASASSAASSSDVSDAALHRNARARLDPATTRPAVEVERRAVVAPSVAVQNRWWSRLVVAFILSVPRGASLSCGRRCERGSGGSDGHAKGGWGHVTSTAEAGWSVGHLESAFGGTDKEPVRWVRHFL